MEPLAIVPNLHVLKERGACNRSGWELCIGTLGLNRAEKALHNGIIVAIPNAAHADFTLLIRQLLLISPTGVLAALSGDRLITKRGIYLGDGFKAKGQVRLLGADIGGDLDCSGGEFENPEGVAFDGTGMKVAGSFFWRWVKFEPTGKVVLINAKLSALDDDEDSWPQFGNLYMDGDLQPIYIGCSSGLKITSTMVEPAQSF